MTSHSAHNTKIIDQHSLQAENYAKMMNEALGTEQSLKRADFVGLHPNDAMLDVSCGTGAILLEFAPNVASATGVDITPAMLDQTKAALAEQGIDNVTLVVGDAINLPFPDHSFDLVTSSAAFHHFEDPAAVLAEMHRVCRPGGRVVISDVTPEENKQAAYDRFETMRDPSHGHAHSVAEFETLAAETGLGASRIQTSLSGPFPFEAVLDTSFPEHYSRAELLELVRQDAQSGKDAWGLRATPCSRRQGHGVLSHVDNGLAASLNYEP